MAESNFDQYIPIYNVHFSMPKNVIFRIFECTFVNLTSGQCDNGSKQSPLIQNIWNTLQNLSLTFAFRSLDPQGFQF